MHPRKLRHKLGSTLIFGIILFISLISPKALANDTLSFLPEQNEFKSELISSPDAFIEFHISDYRYTSQLTAEILISTRNKEAILRAPYSEWIIVKDKESANVYIPVFAHTAQFAWQWKEIKFKKLQDVPFVFIISDVKFVPEVKSPTEREPMPLTYQDFESPVFDLRKILTFGNSSDEPVSLIRNGRGMALKIKNETANTLYFIPFVKPLNCGSKPVEVVFWSKAKKFWVSLASQEVLEALQNSKKNKIDLKNMYYEDVWKKESLECVEQKNILGLFVELPEKSEFMLDQIRAN
jgi:hypothetical protein